MEQHARDSAACHHRCNSTAAAAPWASTAASPAESPVLLKRMLLHLLPVSALACLALTTAAVAMQLWWPAILAGAAVAELCFAVYLIAQYRRLNVVPSPLGPVGVDHHWTVWNRFLNGQAHISKFLSIDSMLSTWFWDVPLDRIKAGNVGDLLAYGFFYKSREQCTAEGRPEFPDQLVRQLESTWGVTFPPGRTPDLPWMTHLWHDIRCHYRPLFLYLVIELLAGLSHLVLRAAGFRSHSLGGVKYYTLGAVGTLASGTGGSSSGGHHVYRHTGNGDGDSLAAGETGVPPVMTTPGGDMAGLARDVGDAVAPAAAATWAGGSSSSRSSQAPLAAPAVLRRRTPLGGGGGSDVWTPTDPEDVPTPLVEVHLGGGSAAAAAVAGPSGGDSSVGDRTSLLERLLPDGGSSSALDGGSSAAAEHPDVGAGAAGTREGRRGGDVEQLSGGSGGRGAAAADTPLLFLHGVGVGLLPYLPFVLRMAAAGRPMVLVETRHLTMRLCRTLLTVDEVVDKIVTILKVVDVPRVAVVSHSYGTFMASRLLQRFPAKVQSMVLVDPVCLAMFTGKLVRNFVYGSALQPGNTLTTWFVARDMLHAASVQRGFHWTELNLWPELLPRRSIVSLAARDPLVPVQEAIIMLANESPTCHVMCHPTHTHATFLTDNAWQNDLARRIEVLAQAADNDLLLQHGGDAGGAPV